MLTTGLLSLNVHEALTFEGAELCLHPDLFVSAPGSANNSLQTRNNQSSQKASDDGKHGASSVGSGTNQVQGSAPLAVGDMIEIRVWDSKPLEAATKSPVTSSSLRKSAGISTSVAQSPPSTIGQASVPPDTPPVPSDVSNDDSSPNQKAPNSTTTRNRANSLQYSESEHANNIDTDEESSIANSSAEKVSEKSKAAEQESSNIRDDGDAAPPPAKTVVTTTPTSSSALPPVFPRGRANTHDNPVKGPAKPATVHRRASSNATGTAVPPKSSKVQLSRHTREISDMTIDTHQLDASDIPQAESNEDDPDDIWSKVGLTHKLRLSFVLLVTEKTLTSLKGNARTQVSMLRQGTLILCYWKFC